MEVFLPLWIYGRFWEESIIILQIFGWSYQVLWLYFIWKFSIIDSISFLMINMFIFSSFSRFSLGSSWASFLIEYTKHSVGSASLQEPWVLFSLPLLPLNRKAHLSFLGEARKKWARSQCPTWHSLTFPPGNRGLRSDISRAQWFLLRAEMYPVSDLMFSSLMVSWVFSAGSAVALSSVSDC